MTRLLLPVKTGNISYWKEKYDTAIEKALVDA